MDTVNALMQGFATAITVSNLLWCFVGCALGTAVGVLPGIGPAVAVAMLLPITAKVDITASMIFFAGIYYGAMYGGSTTSILLNTPGETASMVTAMEGNKMAKSGRAGAALATAAIGSFVAGTIATVIVTLFAPWVAEFAVKLGPPEYFMLMVLAFTTVSAVLGKSTLRGMTALFLGLAIGCIGLDQISGQPRYTMGKAEFMDGIEIVLVAVGLFAVAEVMYAALFEGRVVESQNKLSKVHMTGRDWKRSVPAWLRGTAIGTPFGCIPAGGTEIPDVLELRHREEAGQARGPSRVWQRGRHRRRGRPRGRQQCHGDRRADPAADAGHPHIQHHGHPAGRVPELRHPARAAAVHHVGRAGVGADCVAVHRQPDAAGAEPADGGPVGQAAEDPQAAAVRGHPDLCHGGCLRHAPKCF
jgi:TctA family transporter